MLEELARLLRIRYQECTEEGGQQTAKGILFTRNCEITKVLKAWLDENTDLAFIRAECLMGTGTGEGVRPLFPPCLFHLLSWHSLEELRHDTDFDSFFGWPKFRLKCSGEPKNNGLLREKNIKGVIHKKEPG